MPTFTVIVRKVPFELTKTQLKKEPKSVFYKHYINCNGTLIDGVPPLVVEGDPVVFEIIQRYLDGYNPFLSLPVPISDQLGYGRMLNDLGRDSRTYKLNILHKMVDAETQRFKRLLETRKFGIAESCWEETQVLPFIFLQWLTDLKWIPTTYKIPSIRVDGTVVYQQPQQQQQS